MENDNPQNPVTATEGTPTPPATPPTTVESTNPRLAEEIVPRKQYIGLQGQFNRRNEEFKQLQADFDTINTGKTQAEQLAQQRFDALTSANQRISELDTQLQPLLGLETKVAAFRDIIADPDIKLPAEAALKLFDLLEDLPAGPDVTATKGTILKLANFGNAMAATREKEVSEGATPGFAGGTPGEGLPTSHEGWAKATAGKEPSDPLWGKYFDWVSSQG